MIRILLPGLLSILIFACKTKPASRLPAAQNDQHVFMASGYKYLIHDALELSIRFYGDYDFIFNDFSASLPASKMNIPADGEILFMANTTDPVLKCVSFVRKFEEKNRFEQPLDSLVVRCSEEMGADCYFFYNKTIGANKMLGFIFKGNRILKTEVENIVHSVKTGSGYRKFMPSPLEMAGAAFWSTDSSTVNYLKPVFELKQNEKTWVSNEMDKGLYLQIAGNHLSFLHQAEALNSVWEQWIKSEKLETAFPEISFEKNVFEVIAAKAKMEKVVMLNEAHLNYNHRLFVEKLLPLLKKAGYKILALESLWEDDVALNKRGYAIPKSGYYCNEPNMANLIRTAHELGFEIRKFDDFSTGNREQKQAENLYEILQENPKSKMLVLSGHAHIDESVSGRKKMAAWFKSLSGIDPFTIDQTFLSRYFLENENLNVKNREVLLPDEQAKIQAACKHLSVDLFVYNPRPLQSEDETLTVFDYPDMRKLLLGQVYKKAEYNSLQEKGIPVRQQLFKPSMTYQEMEKNMQPGVDEKLVVLSFGREELYVGE